MVLLMTAFLESSANLLAADVDALVNTVNTVGVMGKGIALQFKNAFPANFKAYERACKDGRVRLGEMFVFDAGQLMKPRWIINFPTKGHWRSGSKISDIASGLDDLRRVIDELGIKSIALPPLGCGNGGLKWSAVRPLIDAKLADLDTEVLVFPPASTPAASAMSVATPRPSLSPGKAALVGMVGRYALVGLGASLSEIQKLMYFLQEAGENLSLQYEPARYGPYADRLRHVLKAVEGHHLRGFGDGSKKVQEAEVIETFPGAMAEADEALSTNPAVVERMDRVFRLVDGFESPYGLELLASVHWVSTRDDSGPTDELDVAVQRVQEWSGRKQRMFTEDHIAIAFERLQAHGWLTKVPVLAK
jgi:O-acetyl-ADP-ribose deacetylase (regulator of RNase III)